MLNLSMEAAVVQMPNWFVVLMGVGTVFIGLICIVILCKVMSLACNAGDKSEPKTEAVTSAPVVQAAAPQAIENRQEIIAAVSAVAAEELGTDISAIRIISFKKI